MALIALSALLSIIFGASLWLAIGDKFPLNAEDKLPTANQIFIYAAALFLPVYLTIFFVH